MASLFKAVQESLNSIPDISSQANEEAICNQIMNLPSSFFFVEEDNADSSMDDEDSVGYTALEQTTPAVHQKQQALLDSFLPPPSCPQQPTLVLDLDETLVHALTGDELTEANAVNSFEVEFRFEEKLFILPVLVRPYVERLLSELSKHYELVLFTASVKPYADAVLARIDPKGYIKHRLYREHLTWIACGPNQTKYVKDLRVLGRDLRRVILVDNSPEVFIQSQTCNGWPIATWKSDPTDEHLLFLTSYLKQMKCVNDFRCLMRLLFSEDGTEDEVRHWFIKSEKEVMATEDKKLSAFEIVEEEEAIRQIEDDVESIFRISDQTEAIQHHSTQTASKRTRDQSLEEVAAEIGGEKKRKKFEEKRKEVPLHIVASIQSTSSASHHQQS